VQPLSSAEDYLDFPGVWFSLGFVVYEQRLRWRGCINFADADPMRFQFATGF